MFLKMKLTVISVIAALLAPSTVAQGAPRYGNTYPAPKPPKKQEGVRATFTDGISGIEGQITIYDDTQVFVGLEITDPDKFAAAADATDIADCLGAGGLQWAIHETWGPPLAGVTESSNELVGIEKLCEPQSSTGEIQTGNEYDPTIACSPSSMYQAPLAVGGENYCNVVFPSSAVREYDLGVSRRRRLQAIAEPPAGPVAEEHNSFDSNLYNYNTIKDKCSTLGEGECEIPPYADVYVCDPCWYPKLPYGCSVGDFTGKYGALPFEEPELTYTRRLKDRFLAKPKVFEDRSVVLKCADGSIAACAKLVEFAGTVP